MALSCEYDYAMRPEWLPPIDTTTGNKHLRLHYEKHRDYLLDCKAATIHIIGGCSQQPKADDSNTLAPYPSFQAVREYWQHNTDKTVLLCHECLASGERKHLWRLVLHSDIAGKHTLDRCLSNNEISGLFLAESYQGNYLLGIKDPEFQLEIPASDTA